MSRIMELAGEAAHTRNMSFTTYMAGDDHIVTKAVLTDVRLKDYFKLTGQKVDAGTLHDMEVVFLIKTPSMVIEDIEVNLKAVPREDCTHVGHSLDPLIGLSVTRGFTANVRSLCGGVKGCTHLVTLLTAAGPAVVQGYMAVMYQRKTSEGGDRAKKSSRMGAYLKNSCYAWREDGEAYRKLSEMAKENCDAR